MSTYWDFRRILKVDPGEECACVGIAKTYGRRCRNKISLQDRITASRLLQQMDRTKDFFSSIDDLERLASLMLCKAVHNCHTRPHLSQVGEMCTSWTESIEREYAFVKKAMTKAVFLEAERELQKMRESTAQVKSELETDMDEIRERKCIVREHPKTSIQPIVTDIKTEDPFTTTAKRSNITKSTLFSPPAPTASSSKLGHSSTSQAEPTSIIFSSAKAASSRSAALVKPYIHPRPETPKSTRNLIKAPLTPEITPKKPTRVPDNNNKLTASVTKPTTTKTEFAFDFGFKTGNKNASNSDNLAAQVSATAKPLNLFTPGVGIFGANLAPGMQSASNAPVFNFGTRMTDRPDGIGLQTSLSPPSEGSIFGARIDSKESKPKPKIDCNTPFSFGLPVKFDAGPTKIGPILLPLAPIKALRIHLDSPDSPPPTPEPRTVGESRRAPLGEKTSTTNLGIMSGTSLSNVYKFGDKDEVKPTSFVFEIPLKSSKSSERNMGSPGSLPSAPPEGKDAEVEAGFHVEGPAYLEAPKVRTLLAPELHFSSSRSNSEFIADEDLNAEGDKENLPPSSIPEVELQTETGLQSSSNELVPIHVPGTFPDTPLHSEVESEAPRTIVEEDAQPSSLIMADSSPLSDPDFPSTPNQHILRPSTPAPEPDVEYEPTFGTALITPPKRYSAYLPSVLQHGLSTPPASPENFLQALQDLGSRSRTRTPSPSPSPSSTVGNVGNTPFPELPVPGTEAGDNMCICCGGIRNPGAGNRIGARSVGVDAGVQTESDTEAGPPEQDNVPHNDEEVKSGCLSSLGFGRLRHGVVMRLRGVRTKISRRRAGKAEKGGSDEGRDWSFTIV